MSRHLGFNKYYVASADPPDLAGRATPSPAYVQNASTQDFSFDAAPAGSLLIVVFDLYRTTGTGINHVSSITGGGLTWQRRVQSSFNPAGTYYDLNLDVWYAITPTDKTGVTFTATFAVEALFSFCFGFAFSNVYAAAPFDTGTGVPSAPANYSGYPSVTISSVNDKVLVFAAFVNEVGSGMSVASGFTRLDTDFQDYFIFEYARFSVPQTDLVVASATANYVWLGYGDVFKSGM